MAGRGLLDRLAAPSQGRDSVESIVAHLRALLNSRPGISSTVPDYGVVDFNDIVHTLPDGVRKIRQSIRQAIQTHEPRLTNISVRHVPSDDPTLMRFEIVARLSEDSKKVLRLQSCMRPGGLFTVD